MSVPNGLSAIRQPFEWRNSDEDQEQWRKLSDILGLENSYQEL